MPEKETKSGKPSCTLKHPKINEVVLACEDLLVTYGSCCKTLMLEHYPELSDIFDPKSLTNFLLRTGRKLKKKLIEDGYNLPESTLRKSPKEAGEEEGEEGK